MVIVKIKGGLGNQLFQYALGRSLSILRKTELKLDATNTKGRPYGLSNFKIKAKIATNEEIQSLKKFKITNFFKPYYKRSLIKEKSEGFDENLLMAGKNVYLDGFWQSEKYFKPIENILRTEFVPQKTSSEFKKISEEIKKNRTISIHIRRTDYLQGTDYEKLDNDYWKKSLEKILRAKSDIKNPKLFVFSDDIEWVRNNLKLEIPTIMVSGEKIPDYEELLLMSQCENNIIANSTFSYWGAWLNTNKNKIVIYPKNWFSDYKRNEKYLKDLIPNGWLAV